MLDKNRSIILVGISQNERSVFSYVSDKLLKEEYKVVGWADNNKKIQGNKVQGGGIVESIEKCVENNKDAFCVVCTIHEYESLTSQLEGLHKEKGVDFEYAFRLEDIYNANSYTYYRHINTKEDQMDYPTSVRIELSSYCNLGCVYCRYHSAYMDEVALGCNKNLEFDVFKEIIKQINDMGTVQKIKNVQKGEMFCNPKWYEMLQYMDEHSDVRRFHFSTNGMMLTPENTDKLAELTFDEISIVFSLDGFSPEENDHFRKNAKFDVIQKNLRYLLNKKDNKFKVHIQNGIILDEDSVKEKEENIKFTLDKNHYLRQNFGEEIDITQCSILITQDEYINKMIEEKDSVHIEYINMKGGIGCPLPIEDLTIDSEGYVCMCGCDPIGQFYRIGNIKEDTMINLWNSDKMRAIRECYKNGENVSICNGCVANVMQDNKQGGVFVKN